MIFSSIFFLFAFLPVSLIVYYVAPVNIRNLVLLLFSLVFYAWGEPIYVILMLFSIAINFIGGLEIEHYVEMEKPRAAKIACISTAVINLALLGFYKYYGFLAENLNAVLPFDIPYKELALPIGISFYTFQAMSYVIDVYRGKVAAQHSFVIFGAYVSMFPQLIAGPIVRYSDVEKQLQKRTVSIEKFGYGAAWFIQGLAKKVLIANAMGSVYESIAALGASNTSVLTAWIGCFAYTMQIYFDFGGYSDMAIGLGKMLGFDFIKNFNYPYIAKSITDFWSRWHISLSSWFKEYVYIPLGGNRVSTLKRIRNIMVVWVLTGLWHGSAWNFIFWGLYYGILLLIEKYFLSEKLERIPVIFQHIYTMVIVMIGWMLFAAPSLERAVSFIGTMFCISGNGIADAASFYYLKSTLALGLIAVVSCTPVVYRYFSRIVNSGQRYKQIAAIGVYMVLFLICVAYLVNATYNPFLYFRF
ncbi:MAG: MBOAT family O-acyltransferase [Schaedlerella sp.]|nr:MBOAT family O-acyltransferase [Schaedlerella sp.]